MDIPRRWEEAAIYPKGDHVCIIFNHLDPLRNYLNDFRLSYSVLLMHRRTDLWGPDGKSTPFVCICVLDSIGPRALALEFDPDRWLDERVKKYLIPNPFIFLPFNAGPRICLGQQVCRSFIHATNLIPPFLLQFAYNEMSFMVIRLLQNFSAITLSPEPAMRPPAWWAEKGGRQAIEQFRPRNHLTLYAMVSITPEVFCSRLIRLYLVGWYVG